MTSPGLEPTPKRESDIEVEKCIYTSASGARFLSVLARLQGTSLYAISHRSGLDVPVHLLDEIDSCDWSDPLLQEMRREALDAIEYQAHVIARAFGIGLAMRGGV
jgi:hypothetical protein